MWQMNVLSYLSSNNKHKMTYKHKKGHDYSSDHSSYILPCQNLIAQNRPYNENEPTIKQRTTSINTSCIDKANVALLIITCVGCK